MMETAIWWTGATVLASVGMIGAAGLVFGMSVTWVFLVTHAMKRMGVSAANLYLVAQWVGAGKPVWTDVDGIGKKEMRPTTNKAAHPGG
jgi:hypothetical protein